MIDSDLARTLTAAIDALEALGVAYHVTGGLASSFHGEPRLTRDIDLVVRLPPESAPRLVERLEPTFLVDRATVDDAARRCGLFQALHRDTLIRIDFHVGERIPGELDRSVEQPIVEGRSIRVVSKEDAILSKLIWIREGSEKSRRDALGMLLDPAPFDEKKLRLRAAELDCLEVLDELQRDRGGAGG